MRGGEYVKDGRPCQIARRHPWRGCAREAMVWSLLGNRLIGPSCCVLGHSLACGQVANYCLLHSTLPGKRQQQLRESSWQQLRLTANCLISSSVRRGAGAGASGGRRLQKTTDSHRPSSLLLSSLGSSISSVCSPSSYTCWMTTPWYSHLRGSLVQ